MAEFQIAIGDTGVNFANPTFKRKKSTASGGRKVAKKTRKKAAKKATKKKVVRKKAAKKKVVRKKAAKKTSKKKVSRRKVSKKKVSRRKTSKKVSRRKVSKKAPARKKVSRKKVAKKSTRRKTRRSSKRKNPSQVRYYNAKTKVTRSGPIVPNGKDIARIVQATKGLKDHAAELKKKIASYGNMKGAKKTQLKKELADLRKLLNSDRELKKMIKVARAAKKKGAKKGEVIQLIELADDVKYDLDKAMKQISGKSSSRRSSSKAKPKRKTAKSAKKSGGSTMAKRKRKSAKRTKAVKITTTPLKRKPKRTVKKSTALKRAGKALRAGRASKNTAANPIFSAALERSDIGRKFNTYLGHSLSEAGGLAIGGLGLVTAPRLVEKGLGYVAPSLYSQIEGKLGVFTGSVMTMAFGLALGIANDKFLKNQQVEATVKGIIGASFVGMGATAGEMIAEKQLSAAPSMSGPYVRKSFEGFVKKGFEGLNGPSTMGAFVDKGFEGYVSEGFEGLEDSDMDGDFY